MPGAERSPCPATSSSISRLLPWSSQSALCGYGFDPMPALEFLGGTIEWTRPWEDDVLNVILLATVTCVPATDDTLVGFWESRKTSRGGIGHSLEFRRDGT